MNNQVGIGSINGELPPAAAHAIREQMEHNLRQLTLRSSSEADLTYGREMWTRCETLTAGGFHFPRFKHATWVAGYQAWDCYFADIHFLSLRTCI